MKKRIGIYGKGRWAQILNEKIALLGSSYELVFMADSSHPHLDQTELESIEWAFVATSPETHYEIVDTCLRAGVNVFCEKPISTSPFEVMDLYELAGERNVCLYVDDVFLWRNQYAQLSAKNITDHTAQWLKNDHKQVTGLKLAKDLAYHHLYMIGALYDLPTVKCEVTDFSPSLKMQLTLDDSVKIDLSYSKNSSAVSHNFLGTDFSESSNDALLDMLKYVLELQTTPNRNRDITIWSTNVLRTLISANPVKVAVVGGGIFGCTAAFDLAKNGFSVTLFESSSNIILGATMKNQLRIHRGYHYPRSDETVKQCRISEYKFKAYFRDSIENSKTHYYAIASHGSKVTTVEYEKFMDRNKLPYARVNNSSINNVLNTDAVSALYAVEEYSYNPDKLRAHIKRRCEEEGVRFVFNREVKKLSELTDAFDQYVIATYASPVLRETKIRQYEICEKPVVRLPEKFRGLSLVILDGPFVSLDPYSADPSLHLIGSVEDALHHTNIGKEPEIPPSLKSYMNKGLVINPGVTKIADFRKRFAGLYNLKEDEIEHIGSFFTIRVVEAHREHDDRRLSTLEDVRANTTHEIFSAKVTSAPFISQRLVERLENIAL